MRLFPNDSRNFLFISVLNPANHLLKQPQQRWVKGALTVTLMMTLSPSISHLHFLFLFYMFTQQSPANIQALPLLYLSCKSEVIWSLKPTETLLSCCSSCHPDMKSRMKISGMRKLVALRPVWPVQIFLTLFRTTYTYFTLLQSRLDGHSAFSLFLLKPKPPLPPPTHTYTHACSLTVMDGMWPLTPPSL